MVGRSQGLGVTWANLGSWTFTLQQWELVKGFKQRDITLSYLCCQTFMCRVV